MNLISPRILAIADEIAANLRAMPPLKRRHPYPVDDGRGPSSGLTGVVNAMTARQMERVWWTR